MEVKWEKYKDSQILYIDYRGAHNSLEMIGVFLKEIEVERKLKGKINVLLNFTNTSINQAFLDEMNMEIYSFRKDKIEKLAIVGIGSVHILLFKCTNILNTKNFDNEEKAKEWLSSKYQANNNIIFESSILE